MQEGRKDLGERNSFLRHHTLDMRVGATVGEILSVRLRVNPASSAFCFQFYQSES